MFIKAHSKYILHLKRKRIYVLNEMDSLLFLASYFHFCQSTFCLSIVYIPFYLIVHFTEDVHIIINLAYICIAIDLTFV